MAFNGDEETWHVHVPGHWYSRNHRPLPISGSSRVYSKDPLEIQGTPNDSITDGLIFKVDPLKFLTSLIPFLNLGNSTMWASKNKDITQRK